jgi:hypothetical protein
MHEDWVLPGWADDYRSPVEPAKPKRSKPDLSRYFFDLGESIRWHTAIIRSQAKGAPKLDYAKLKRENMERIREFERQIEDAHARRCRLPFNTSVS